MGIVSDADKAYFARIGAAKAESHADATREHLKLTLDERMRRGWQLYEQFRAVANNEGRNDDPSQFYERARQLGLYRG